MLKSNERQIMQHVAENGPCSCVSIAKALGMNREHVYRFLYKARCYDGGKHWIDNIKQDPLTNNGPGEYVITDFGKQELATT